MPTNAIFISYSRQNSEFVSKLVRLLSQASIKVWQDREKIIGGDAWDKSVQEAIEQADIMLLVLSKAAMESDIVRAEYSYALDHGKKVIPIKLEECKIDLRLHPLHHIDFSTDRVRGQHELAKALALSPRKAKRVRNSKIFSAKKSRPWFKIILILVMIGLAYFLKDKWMPLLIADPWEIKVQVVKLDDASNWLVPSWRQLDLVVDDSTYTSDIDEMGMAAFQLAPGYVFTKTKRAQFKFNDDGAYGYHYSFPAPDIPYTVSGNNDTLRLKTKLDSTVLRKGIVIDNISGNELDNAKITLFGRNESALNGGSVNLILPLKKISDSIEITAFARDYDTLTTKYLLLEDTLFKIPLRETLILTEEDRAQIESGS